MYKVVICTFILLAWLFWELSGGSDFKPPAPEEDPKVLATYDIDQIETPRSSHLTVIGNANIPAVAVAPAQNEAAIVANNIDAFSQTYTPSITTSGSNNADIRWVTASRVNMRSGPSTSFEVIAKLNRDDRIEVISAPGGGWVELRVMDTGQIGWTAKRLLSPANNQ